MDLRAEKEQGNAIPAFVFIGCSPVRDDSGGASQNTRHTCHSCHAVGKDCPLQALKEWITDILPSERAFSCKMKLEARWRQGFRTDLTSSQLGTKLLLKKGGTGTAADIIFSDGKYGRDIAMERMKNLLQF